MVKPLAIVLALAAVAGAHRDPIDPAPTHPDADAAATTGDWPRVADLTSAVLARQLPPAELAEAHRLAGIAAFYQQRLVDAETHFVAYLRAEPDGRLDPALYPPEVRDYFEIVRGKHLAELHAMRPKPRRYILLNLVPMAGQFQNGEKTKGIVLGAMLGTMLAVNVTSYFVLRSWCTTSSANGRTGATCDDATSDHYSSAQALRSVNLVSGGAAILTYLFGVYDGVNVYRQRTRELSIQPYIGTNTVGIMGSF
jgi:hypothetical protein